MSKMTWFSFEPGGLGLFGFYNREEKLLSAGDKQVQIHLDTHPQDFRVKRTSREFVGDGNFSDRQAVPGDQTPGILCGSQRPWPSSFALRAVPQHGVKTSYNPMWHRVAATLRAGFL